MIRINYKKHKDRDIWFTKNYLTGKKIVQGTIIHRDKDHKFQVIINDLNVGELLYEQLCEDFAHAKRIVKNMFKLYGVGIDDEVRKKLDLEKKV